jgi:hypothetical protein
LSLNPPREFHDSSPDSILKEMDVSFENLCASLEECGVNHPKELTTFEFRQRINYFQSKKKPKGYESDFH